MVSTRILWISKSGVTLQYACTGEHTEYQIYADGKCIKRQKHARYKRIVSRTALISRFGKFETECPPDKIPTEVAVEGKPAIASYLYVGHKLEKEEIAATMEITESTVTKYLHRFRSAEKMDYS